MDGIAFGNQLGPGIRVASLPELGPGGSWSTCLMGCSAPQPRDVAHVQFRSRIAFKLVWCPGLGDADAFASFVLVDDAGNALATGTPSGALPPMREREMNFRAVVGSKCVLLSLLRARDAVSRARAPRRPPLQVRPRRRAEERRATASAVRVRSNA